MPYSTLPTQSIHGTAQATWANQVKANIEACAVGIVSAAGQIVYASGANQLSTLAATDKKGRVFVSGAGGTGAPVWTGGLPVLIERKTATGSESSISFTSIPQDYAHLLVRFWRIRSSHTATSVSMYVRLNGDTGTNYAYQRSNQVDAAQSLAGGASTSLFYDAPFVPGASMPSKVFAAGEIMIFSYAQTDYYVTGRLLPMGFGDISTGRLMCFATGSYVPSTLAAITSLSLTLSSGNFAAGGTLELYGVQLG